MSTTNNLLGTPFQSNQPSWYESIASGVAIAAILRFLRGRRSNGNTSLAVIIASLLHVVPRLQNFTATKKRRATLHEMGASKLQQRDERRESMRSAVTMSNLSEESAICRLLAHELLTKMRSGELTCEKIVRSFCSRSLRLGTKTNAVTDELYDEAIARAIVVDQIRASPDHDVLMEPSLFGLPISIKDQINVKGYDSTAGLQVRVFSPATEDAAVVALLREAGAIPFVKTNVPQSLMVTESYNRIFGRALNPWNVKRTPGGSSGGEGAMVGMDASPLGVGTDIGGSIRTPAAYCGIVGLKPSSGRVSRVGLMSPRLHQRNGQEGIKSVVGPMARSVEDLVLAMKVWLTPEQKLWDYDGVAPNPSFNQIAFESQQPLRIGMVVSDDFFPACDPSRRSVLEAAEALRSQGHVIVELRTKNSDGGGSGTNPLGVAFHPEVERSETVLPGFGDAFGLFAKILGADGTMHFQREVCYFFSYFFGFFWNFSRATLTSLFQMFFSSPFSCALYTLFRVWRVKIYSMNTSFNTTWVEFLMHFVQF